MWAVIVKRRAYAANLKRVVPIEIVSTIGIVFWRALRLNGAITIPMNAIAANLFRVKIAMMKTLTHKIRIYMAPIGTTNSVLWLNAFWMMHFRAMLLTPF